MKETAVNVGKRIKYFRKKLNLSQEKLALEAGINPAFLGHLERGLKSPTVDTLAKVSGALGITLSELLFFEEEENLNVMAVRKASEVLNSLPPEKAEALSEIITELAKIINTD